VPGGGKTVGSPTFLPGTEEQPKGGVGVIFEEKRRKKKKRIDVGISLNKKRKRGGTLREVRRGGSGREVARYHCKRLTKGLSETRLIKEGVQEEKTKTVQEKEDDGGEAFLVRLNGATPRNIGPGVVGRGQLGDQGGVVTCICWGVLVGGPEVALSIQLRNRAGKVKQPKFRPKQGRRATG